MKTFKKKIFYGWFVVAACFMVMSVTIGVVGNTAGVFMKPVCAAMGFSRRAMGMNATVISAVMMIIALFAGRIYAKFTVKQVMCAGSVVLGAAYFSYSLAQNLTMFYISSFFCGLSLALLTAVSVSLLITNWFHEKRGTAMGIAVMGSGIGGMIFNPLAGSLIEILGWRQTYQILGIIMLVVTVTASFFVVKSRPSDIGLAPLGGDSLEEKRDTTHGMTLKQAMRLPKFYAICICTALITVCVTGVAQNVAPHLSDVGFTPAFAAIMASVCMGAVAVGKVFLGFLFDKIGARRATLISNCACILGLAGALLVPFSPALGLIALGTGLGGAFGSVASPIITRTVYGPREYSAILGVVTATINIGGMFIPLVIGGVYDSFNSYKPAFAVMLVIVAVATVVLQIALRKTKSEAA